MVEPDDVRLDEPGPGQQVADQAGVLRDCHAKGLLDRADGREGVNARARAADALGEEPGIARIAALEDELHPAEHRSRAPRLAHDAIGDLDLDPQVPTDPGDRVDRDPWHLSRPQARSGRTDRTGRASRAESGSRALQAPGRIDRLDRGRHGGSPAGAAGARAGSPAGAAGSPAGGPGAEPRPARLDSVRDGAAGSRGGAVEAETVRRVPVRSKPRSQGPGGLDRGHRHGGPRTRSRSPARLSRDSAGARASPRCAALIRRCRT